jgi:hypothetical protein
MQWIFRNLTFIRNDRGMLMCSKFDGGRLEPMLARSASALASGKVEAR